MFVQCHLINLYPNGVMNSAHINLFLWNKIIIHQMDWTLCWVIFYVSVNKVTRLGLVKLNPHLTYFLLLWRNASKHLKIFAEKAYPVYVNSQNYMQYEYIWIKQNHQVGWKMENLQLTNVFSIQNLLEVNCHLRSTFQRLNPCRPSETWMKFVLCILDIKMHHIKFKYPI